MNFAAALRYAVPNTVTLISLSFGLLSMLASVDGRYADAAWLIMLSVLADKMDGFLARLLKGASEFGVQLDSFADFLSFGVAPAVLWYNFFTSASELPLSAGPGHALLIFACWAWILAVTFRLARYNIVGQSRSCQKVFFGVPTTLMGGLMVALFLAGLKYSGAAVHSLAQVEFETTRLLGNELEVGQASWAVWPILILVGAVLMASTVKIPKLGKSRSLAVTLFVFANVLAGYTFAIFRLFPEYLAMAALLWSVGSLIWAHFSESAQSLKPPKIFPGSHEPPAAEDEPLTVEDQHASPVANR